MSAVAGRLLTAPAWAHVLIQGVAFAVLMLVVEWCEGTASLRTAVLVAVVVGVVWGLTFGVGRARWHRQVREGLELPEDQLREAAEAVVSGPAPADRATRAAAATLAGRQLERSRKNGPAGPVLLLVVALAAGANAVLVEPRMWLVAVTLVVVAVYVWWLPRHLAERVALLSGN